MGYMCVDSTFFFFAKETIRYKNKPQALCLLTRKEKKKIFLSFLYGHEYLIRNNVVRFAFSFST